MVRRWDKWRNPWDREYAMRGRLWRGQSSIDPLPRLAPPPGPVLEVGCGDGKFLHALQGAGYRWVGVDFSPRAVALAQQAGPGPLAVADARRLPFRGHGFPVVVARYLLGALRVDGRAQAASELLRMLAPKGLLVVEEFATTDFRYGAGRRVEANTFERNQGITTHYFEPGELAALLGLRGQEVERRHTLRVQGERVPRVALQFSARPD